MNWTKLIGRYPSNESVLKSGRGVAGALAVQV